MALGGWCAAHCGWLWTLLVLGWIYVEPLIIAGFGERCRDSLCTTSDLLRTFVMPLRLGLDASPVLQALLLLTWDAGFWALVVWAARDRAPPGQTLPFLREFACLVAASLGIHALLCTQSTTLPTSTGLHPLDALLSPTPVLPNALFAPRLAWAALVVQDYGLTVRGWAGWIALTLTFCTALDHLNVYAWLFTHLVAWSLHGWRVAADTGHRRLARRRGRDMMENEHSDAKLFTVNDGKDEEATSEGSDDGSPPTPRQQQQPLPPPRPPTPATAPPPA